jgi:ribosomal protein L11 methylase PrmA
VARTGQAVEEREDGTLVTFAPDEGAADALIAELGEAAASPPWRSGAGGAGGLDHPLARRTGRPPVRPADGGAVLGRGAERPAAATVVLDPETAFGSGEHGSTRAALALLERWVRPGDRVLDLGSGSGILAIAAVKLGAARAIGIEIDTEANVVAVRNASRNEVRDQVEFLDGDAGDLAPLLGPADLLLSNILRSVNAQLLRRSCAACGPGEWPYSPGWNRRKAPLFRPLLAPAGLTTLDEQRDAGWWSVAARRD